MYGILQDNDQPTLSASDKDLKPNFSKLCDLAFLIPHEFERKYSDELPLKTSSEIKTYEERKLDVLEHYLDKVFDVKSKLPRAQWEKITCSDKGNFIFSARSLRKEIDSTIFGGSTNHW